MDLTPYILPLAEEDDVGGLVRIGGLILLLVIGAASWLAGKLKEKARRDEAARQQQQPPAREPPPPPAPPRATPADEQARAQAVIAQLFGIPQPEPKPAPPPPPPAREQPEALGRGVEHEVARLQEDLAAEETQRRRRLAGPAGRAQAEDRRGTGRLPAVAVDLTGRQEARRAIVHAEVLGRPKALRTDPELWDQ